jgi:hypothetical protein
MPYALCPMPYALCPMPCRTSYESSKGYMLVSRSSAKQPTQEETRQLEKLQVQIERAVADGKISNQEMEDIKRAMLADGKVTVEELELYRILVTDRIVAGEVEYEF